MFVALDSFEDGIPGRLLFMPSFVWLCEFEIYISSDVGNAMNTVYRQENTSLSFSVSPFLHLSVPCVFSVVLATLPTALCLATPLITAIRVRNGIGMYRDFLYKNRFLRATLLVNLQLLEGV